MAGRVLTTQPLDLTDPPPANISSSSEHEHAPTVQIALQPPLDIEGRIHSFSNTLLLTRGEKIALASGLREVERLMNQVFPGRHLSVHAYGSVRSGLALATSDLNANLVFDSDTHRVAHDECAAIKEYMTRTAHPSFRGVCDLKRSPTIFLHVSGWDVRLTIGSTRDEDAAVAMTESVLSYPILKPIVALLAHAASKQNIRIPSFVIANLAIFYLETAMYPLYDPAPPSLKSLRSIVRFVATFSFTQYNVGVGSDRNYVLRSDRSDHPLYMTRNGTRNIARGVKPEHWANFHGMIVALDDGWSKSHTREATTNNLCTISEKFDGRRAQLARIWLKEMEVQEPRNLEPVLHVLALLFSPRKRPVDAVDHGDSQNNPSPAKKARLNRGNDTAITRNSPRRAVNKKPGPKSVHFAKKSRVCVEPNWIQSAKREAHDLRVLRMDNTLPWGLPSWPIPAADHDSDSDDDLDANTQANTSINAGGDGLDSTTRDTVDYFDSPTVAGSSVTPTALAPNEDLVQRDGDDARSFEIDEDEPEYILVSDVDRPHSECLQKNRPNSGEIPPSKHSVRSIVSFYESLSRPFRPPQSDNLSKEVWKTSMAASAEVMSPMPPKHVHAPLKKRMFGAIKKGVKAVTYTR